ncbi:MAG: archease [Candidatus Bathyarchaeia archaeon]
MSRKEKFKFLEHRADAYVAAYGKTLEEAFENAALATFEVMTETKKVTPKFEELIEVEGFDEKALLYNWLEALLIKFDTTENLYSKFTIEKIKRTETGFKLKAKIQGEKFNPEKHPQKVGVKAITYHQMEIMKKPNEAIVKFILDI